MKCMCVLIAAWAAACLSVEAGALKVLMIGNSFSQSVLKQMPAVARATGCELDLANLYIGGCPLDLHWCNVEKAATDSEARPYEVGLSWTSCAAQDAPIQKVMKGGRANIPQALAADRWDIVTIQQASGKSAFYETYQPYADKLIAKIREFAPQAEIRVQETWSYSPYDVRLAAWGLTPDTMYARLHTAYATLARKQNLKIIPTGTAVQLYRARRPVVWEKVFSPAERAALRPPTPLPFFGDPVGKAWWSAQGKLQIDALHFNPAGEYLQGCVWVAALFGKDVTACTYAPAGLSENEAALMRVCAWEAVAGEMK